MIDSVIFTYQKLKSEIWNLKSRRAARLSPQGQIFASKVWRLNSKFKVNHHQKEKNSIKNGYE
jgi:hypothetical protein